jgi:hypothetical protein
MCRILSVLLLSVLGLSSCASCSDMISHARTEKTPTPIDRSVATEATQLQPPKTANVPNEGVNHDVREP